MIHRCGARRSLSSTLLVGLLAVTTAGCVEHAFQTTDETHSAVTRTHMRIDIQRAADILFVIDNSGSMREEQENLARQSSSVGEYSTGARTCDEPARCCDQANYERLYQHVENDRTYLATLTEDYQAILNDCGFVERLLLYGNRFHIGVISTDMNDCDHPYGSDADDRASVPQRGCLQTSPGAPDLRVLDWQTPAAELPSRFYEMVTNVGIYGSAYEKGLAAVEHFLTPGHDVPAASACDLRRDCSGDLAAFWRDTERNAVGDEVETKLVVIFLTDEEDCSHGATIDEQVNGNTTLCYSRRDLLTPSDHFVTALRTLKPQPELVAMGLVGGVYGEAGRMSPFGCKAVGGLPSNACEPAGGNSVATCTHCIDGHPVCECHPALSCPNPAGGPDIAFEATNCCQAEAADRYFEVGHGLMSHGGAFMADTICSSSYRDTMIAIADMVNVPTQVKLSEVPSDHTKVVVKMLRRGATDWQPVPFYDVEQELPAIGGWSFRRDHDGVIDRTVIQFFLDWIPEPGDEVQVEVEIER